MMVIGLFLFSTLLLGALIFIPAGRLDYSAGWLLLALMISGFTLVTVHVVRRTPSLLRRRMKAGAGTPLWDKVFVSVLQLLFAAILVVGGLDAGRYGWKVLAPSLQFLGVALVIASLLLLGWAMGQNPHFEATVRIQTDQQHRVIQSGPYRIVRHPGYVAAILLVFGMALTLRSGWSLLPASLAAFDMIARTAVEDRFLQKNLPGYTEFTQRTRFRLLPGVW